MIFEHFNIRDLEIVPRNLHVDPGLRAQGSTFPLHDLLKPFVCENLRKRETKITAHFTSYRFSSVFYGIKWWISTFPPAQLQLQSTGFQGDVTHTDTENASLFNKCDITVLIYNLLLIKPLRRLIKRLNSIVALKLFVTCAVIFFLSPPGYEYSWTELSDCLLKIILS